MSKMEKHYIKCDRCGRQEDMVENSKEALFSSGRYIPVSPGWGIVRTDNEMKDLCPDCLALYKENFDRFMKIRKMEQGGPLDEAW